MRNIEKRARKFVKDKAIVNFLLEHMKPAKIDFSKIKVPSFINFLEDEEKKSSDSSGLSTNYKDNKFIFPSVNFLFEEQKK